MGCGASTASPPANVDGAPPKVKFHVDERSNGDGNGFSRFRLSSTDSVNGRRKTTTRRMPRRQAVSNETTEDMSHRGGLVDLKLTPKAPDVTERMLEALQKHPLFAHLALPLMHRCIEASEELTYRAGDSVITEDDAGDRFYICASGSFEAFHAATSKKARPSKEEGAEADGVDPPKPTATTSAGAASGETLLQVFGEGDVFGELALL